MLLKFRTTDKSRFRDTDNRDMSVIVEFQAERIRAQAARIEILTFALESTAEQLKRACASLAELNAELRKIREAERVVRMPR